MKTTKTPKSISVIIDGTKIILSLLKKGWVKGAFDNYRFWARVSNTDSAQGIEEGRVLALEVRRIEDGWEQVTDIINYCGYWIMRPKATDFAVYEKIMRALEKVPLRPAFDM